MPEANPIRKTLLNWTPMQLHLPPVLEERVPWERGLVRMYRTKTGLYIYHPNKVYSYPAALRIVGPENLAELKVGMVRIEQMMTVGKFTKYARQKEVLQVTILPMKTEPRFIKYRLVVVATDGKSTGKGARQSAHLVNADRMKFYWATTNSSSSGNHWIAWWIVVAPINVNPLFCIEYISNRGNDRSYLYDPVRGKYVERYEVLEELGGWPWGRVIKMRDNLEGKTFTAVELEYHEARKTAAYTEHSWEPIGALPLINDTRHPDKTHWSELREVTAPVKIRTTRMTNLGNRRTWEVIVYPDGRYEVREVEEQ